MGSSTQIHQTQLLTRYIQMEVWNNDHGYWFLLLEGLQSILSENQKYFCYNQAWLEIYASIPG